jgi:hypothetical protein
MKIDVSKRQQLDSSLVSVERAFRSSVTSNNHPDIVRPAVHLGRDSPHLICFIDEFLDKLAQ